MRIMCHAPECQNQPAFPLSNVHAALCESQRYDNLRRGITAAIAAGWLDMRNPRRVFDHGRPLPDPAEHQAESNELVPTFFVADHHRGNRSICWRGLTRSRE